MKNVELEIGKIYILKSITNANTIWASSVIDFYTENPKDYDLDTSIPFLILKKLNDAKYTARYEVLHVDALYYIPESFIKEAVEL